MNDLIDRQAAIKILRESEAYDADIPNRADGVRDAIIDIMSLPTIERKKGKWIHDDPKDAIEAIFLARPKCSECGFEIAYETNFCPYCGAGMRQ